MRFISFFQWIWDFLSQADLPTIIVFVFVTTFLMIVWKLSTSDLLNICQWIQRIILRKKRKKIKTHFYKTVHHSQMINNLLEDMLVYTKASRAGVIQYHNGGRSLHGISFQKASVTNEKLQIGAQNSQIKNWQSMPISVFSYWIHMMTQIEPDEFFTRTIDDIRKDDKNMFTEFKRADTRLFVMKQLYSSDKVPLGFLFIDFQGMDKVIGNTDKQCINDKASRIASILEHEFHDEQLDLGIEDVNNSQIYFANAIKTDGGCQLIDRDKLKSNQKNSTKKK